MEKLTKEVILKRIEYIKSMTDFQRALGETTHDYEDELYRDFVKSVANGEYRTVEEIIAIAKLVNSVEN